MIMRSFGGRGRHFGKVAVLVATVLGPASASGLASRPTAAFAAAPPVATWVELSPTGSPPGVSAYPKAIGYDPATNVLVVLFPGSPPYVPHGNEVWTLSNANGLGGSPAWTRLAPAGPPPPNNGGQAAVYDPASNQLFVYGGCTANCSPARSEVFVLSNANGLAGAPTWRQVAVTNPQARSNHSAAYVPASDRLITFGGDLAFPSSQRNDARVLTNASGLATPSSWQTLATSGGPPPPRTSSPVAYDQTGDRLMLFGGMDFVSCCYNINNLADTWVLSNASGGGGTPTWTNLAPPGPAPSGRENHATAYDASTNRLYVFGGNAFNNATQSFGHLGDLWMLSNANGLGGTPSWTQLTPGGSAPGPRTASAAFDAANQRMILLDQGDASVATNRVWVLQVTAPNRSPVCTSVAPNSLRLWPPNHRFSPVSLKGASDPDGDPVAIAITGVTQDEPANGLGDGDTSPDAAGGATPDHVYLRAERSGTGDGRVYRIAFTASDGKGGTCSGTVTLGVPRDQGPAGGPLDSGLVVNSFGP